MFVDPENISNNIFRKGLFELKKKTTVFQFHFDSIVHD